MSDVTRYPYLTTRPGSSNYYYKRDIPPDLRDAAQREQIWKSLRTPDRVEAARRYAGEHHRVETDFERWRRELSGAVVVTPAPQPQTVALTPTMARRVVAEWKAAVIEDDFQSRAALWQAAQAAPDDLIQGKLISFEDRESDPIVRMLEADAPLENIFLCVLRLNRMDRREALKRRHALGDVNSEVACLTERSLGLSAADLRKLARQCQLADLELLEAQIKGLPAITPEVESPGVVGVTTPLAIKAPHMSALIGRYVDEEGKLKEWPLKDSLRWRAMLAEWVAIVGDKPVNGYGESDGADFRTVQLSLPVRRGGPQYRGLTARQCVERANELAAKGDPIPRLAALTIKDKVGCVGRFFRWARTIERTTVNPVEDVKIERPKKRNRGKTRHPWQIEELNAMFQAPLYTGCRSESHWKEPGRFNMRDTAKYWAPLLSLFSGLRLGEIIQMPTSDIRQEAGVWYFEVTNESDEPQDEDDRKSVKTAAGHRQVPIHKALIGHGLLELVKRRGPNARLFPDFQRSKSDHSWSKTFSQHFRRFRLTITQRKKISFHSLRHNFEDALRAAKVEEDIRDALQGHEGDGGVGRDYGEGYSIDVLNECVQRVEYRGLILPSIGDTAAHAWSLPPGG